MEETVNWIHVATLCIAIVFIVISLGTILYEMTRNIGW